MKNEAVVCKCVARLRENVRERKALGIGACMALTYTRLKRQGVSVLRVWYTGERLSTMHCAKDKSNH